MYKSQRRIKMKKKLSPYLFARFYSGLLSPGKEKELLSSHEVDQMMQQQWENPEEMKTGAKLPDFDRISENIQHQISAKKPFYLHKFTKIAAAMLLLIGIASAWLFFNNSLQKTDGTTVTAQAGNSMEYTLPDGSKVFLTGNSSITYQKNFSDFRNIEFQGLAFFEVAKTGNPFRIFAGETTIEVTGTSFSVDAREEKQITVIELVEGSVIITGTGNKTLTNLVAGQKFSFNKNSKEFSVVNTSIQTGWSQPKLAFSNASVREITAILEQRFGQDIDYSPQLESMRFTFSISNETLEQTLLLMSGIAPVSFQKNKNSYLIQAAE